MTSLDFIYMVIERASVTERIMDRSAPRYPPRGLGLWKYQISMLSILDMRHLKD